jgi:hypothetical protein
MNRFITLGLTQLVLFLLIFSPLVSAQVSELQQEESPQFNTPMPPQTAPRENRPAFTQPELDQMLAPIALYPDALLSQILMAATYPIEVIEAARWSKANPNLKGQQAVQAVAQQSWDQSVKSLVVFPQVLSVMDDQLPWMERLGDAFISQQQQVMDTVQSLRQKASATGNLNSNEQIRVNQEGQSIVIEPTDPQVVYVPYYDPMVMYGPWWWSAYPPIYWGMWPGYFYGPGFGFGFGWGVGIGIGPGFFFGGFNWQHRYATFARGGLWAHDPFHRRGVPYRDLALSRQFGRTSASALARSEFRGHESSSFGNHGGFGNRPDARGGLSSRPSEPSSPMRGIPERSGGASGFSGHPTPAPHAFEGIGQGGATRDFSMRGHESSQGSFGSSPGFGSRSSGGFHGGGGGRGGGGHR